MKLRWLSLIVFLFFADRFVFADEPGFIVYGANDHRLTALNFFDNKCVIFRPLLNPAWASPDVKNLDEILTADLHNIAWEYRRKDDAGGYFFELPGGCRRAKIWVIVPEAYQALGRINASDVDDTSAHLDSTSRLTLNFADSVGQKVRGLENSRKFTAELEQLAWGIMRNESVAGYNQSPVYGLEVRLENGMVKPVPLLLREIALDGELEKAATNGARKILDLMAMQRLDDQWLVNLISRTPDSSRISASAVVPETNASIEIPISGDSSQIRIVDNQSHVSLKLQEAAIVQVRMTRGCSIKARDGASVILARPEKGVIVMPAETEDVCSVISASGRNCSCQSASRQIVEIHVASPDQIRGVDSSRSYGRLCVWDAKCSLWTTVDARGHCAIKPLSCESGRAARMELPLQPGCSLDAAGTLQCDLKDDSAGAEECLKLLGDQWKITFPEYAGMPLCQSLAH